MMDVIERIISNQGADMRVLLILAREKHVAGQHQQFIESLNHSNLFQKMPVYKRVKIVLDIAKEIQGNYLNEISTNIVGLLSKNLENADFTSVGDDLNELKFYLNPREVEKVQSMYQKLSY